MAVGAEREPEIRTLPPDVVADRLRRIHVLRNVAPALVAGLMLVGATGLLGVRAGPEAVSADGYDVQVDYPRITRGGLSADFDVQVVRPGGFGGSPVTIAATKDYLELFDIQRVFSGTDQGDRCSNPRVLDLRAPTWRCPGRVVHDRDR
jgi:hypothetical protein